MRSAKLIVGLVVAGLLGVVAISQSVEAGDIPKGDVSWLATGDSYSSGEGIAGTGIGDDVCARSDLAYGPNAAGLLEQQRGWSIDPLVFSACTGALASDMFNGRTRDSLWQQSQAMGAPASGRFDVITLSFGGNDLGFGDAINDCVVFPDGWTDFSGIAAGDQCDALPSTGDIEGILSDPSWTSSLHVADGVGVGTLPDGQPGSLTELYEYLIEHHLTDRGVLVVLGYPRILAPSEEWGAWRGDQCQLISREDADAIGTLIETLDEGMEAALRSADAGGGHSIYISRLDLFDDGGRYHSVCSANQTEWINGFTLGISDGSGRVAHSYHPNEIGHTATAEVLANRLDVQLRPPPPTTIAPPSATTTQPPIQGGTTWDIGESFAAECVVAWPTAPVYTSNAIQMRMSCLGVPSQFLFVDVAYGDPNLPMAPNTGYVVVRGTIVDIAESSYGFRTLVVIADDVVIP